MTTKEKAAPKPMEAPFEDMKQEGGSEEEASTGWRQYNPGTNVRPRQRQFHNAASIWVYAMKLITREMRQAKGVRDAKRY